MAAKRTQQESVGNTIGAVMVQQVCVTLASFLMSFSVIRMSVLSGDSVGLEFSGLLLTHLSNWMFQKNMKKIYELLWFICPS